MWSNVGHLCREPRLDTWPNLCHFIVPDHRGPHGLSHASQSLRRDFPHPSASTEGSVAQATAAREQEAGGELSLPFLRVRSCAGAPLQAVRESQRSVGAAATLVHGVRTALMPESDS